LRGGIARTTTALAAALSARGSLAGFFVPIRQYPGVLYPGRRDTDPDACPRLAEAMPCYHVLEPWTWRPLIRRLRAAAPDALVLPYWTSAWAPLFWFLARSVAAPVIAVVHNPTDHDGDRRTRHVARLALGRCRGFLCHAHDVARIIEHQFPGATVVVHPLPPEARGQEDRELARSRLGLGTETVAALCFGLIRPYKGVDVLLEAVARLPAEVPLVLLLAGEPWGKLAGRLRRRIARSDLAGRVVASLEWVPEAEAPAWFAAADAAVLPYRSATGSRSSAAPWEESPRWSKRGSTGCWCAPRTQMRWPGRWRNWSMPAFEPGWRRGPAPPVGGGAGLRTRRPSKLSRLVSSSGPRG
jgi:glycosyltransferase involved in cell wall biosynthesis